MRFSSILSFLLLPRVTNQLFDKKYGPISQLTQHPRTYPSNQTLFRKQEKIQTRILFVLFLRYIAFNLNRQQAYEDKPIKFMKNR